MLPAEEVFNEQSPFTARAAVIIYMAHHRPYNLRGKGKPTKSQVSFITAAYNNAGHFTHRWWWAPLVQKDARG